MEGSLAMHLQQERSRIQSRNGSAVARGRSASRPRRPSWCKRALDGLLLWRKLAAVDGPSRRARAAPGRPLWRSSLKAAASACARVACLCEPVCSTDGALGVHADAPAPRRGRGRGMGRAIGYAGRSPEAAAPVVTLPAGECASWRCFFRGRSLNDDVLMRRFVLEEEATRRRVEMETLAKRYGRRWLPPGPSRLSKMSLADDVAEDDEAGESGSTPPQCSEADQSL